ncbi:MAG: TIGR03915 family putative DNA repair protein [Odoribacteraceae bacterium]|nr:TIGR03915 family putative DNA repair protein [Odoribacteraceae bacterium]
MSTFLHDGTFNGLLTALFEAYRRGEFPEFLTREGGERSLFEGSVVVIRADAVKAARVWEGVRARISPSARAVIVAAWLSEEPGVDRLIFRHLRGIIDAPGDAARKFGAEALELSRLARKVARERERVVQFLRFRMTGDGTFLAFAEPLYDVLAGVIDYLADRFENESWLVYDTKREIGFYHRDRRVSEILPGDALPPPLVATLECRDVDEKERQLQELWKSYLEATTIRERLDARPRRERLPARFWKYFEEK